MWALFIGIIIFAVLAIVLFIVWNIVSAMDIKGTVYESMANSVYAASIFFAGSAFGLLAWMAYSLCV